MPLLRTCGFPDPFHSVADIHIEPLGFIVDISQHYLAVDVESKIVGVDIQLIHNQLSNLHCEHGSTKLKPGNSMD